jgi:Family of unknown function (DUF5946)
MPVEESLWFHHRKTSHEFDVSASPKEKKLPCCGCGAVFPSADGPIHRYMTSSPECRSAYGVALAREFSDPAYAKLNRMSVDAYAVQHPGSISSQTIQSVAVHLCRLCIILEDGFSVEHANDVMLAIHRVEHQFRWLEPPRARGEVTVSDVVEARGAEEHTRQVERWAKSCWWAWSQHRATTRGWLPGEIRAKHKYVERKSDMRRATPTSVEWAHDDSGTY